MKTIESGMNISFLKVRMILAGMMLAVAVSGIQAATIEDARRLAEDGNLDDAIEMLRKLEAEQPKDASIPKLLGDYYMAVGEEDNARDAYELARKKGSRDAILGLAEMANLSYDVDGARALVEEYRKTLKKGKRVVAEDESGDLVDRIDRIDNALDRVEMIEIVDSLVVDAEDFFRHYRLSPESGSLNSTDVLPEGFASADPTVVYEPESGREMIWAAPGENGSFNLLSSSALYGDTWEQPVPLGDQLGGGGDANYPFLMPDGITLYFASDGEESLGGLDLFISRRGDDGFLQPQNLGMPYNSPYDDYMLAIDEFTGAGWWASDRNRIPGKVTIYIFVPQELRKNVDPDSPELVARARMNAIRTTWNEGTDRAALLEKIAAISTDRKASSHQFEIYISGRGIVTNFNEFKNPASRDAMHAYQVGVAKVTEAERRLASLRAAYAKGDRDNQDTILSMEKELESARAALVELRNDVVDSELRK